MPPSGAEDLVDTGTDLGMNFSVTGVDDKRWRRLSVEPVRLAGGLEAKDEARPRVDVLNTPSQ